MDAFTVRPLAAADQAWVKGFLETHNHSLLVVSLGQVYEASALPGFGALLGEKPVGLLTYRMDGDQCEVVTLHSAVECIGVGSALIAAVREQAATAGVKRLWLVTTNDNLPALKFYQKRGFTLCAIHRDAMLAVRRVKPFVPLVGLDGIPLRDVLELEMTLDSA